MGRKIRSLEEEKKKLEARIQGEAERGKNY